MGDLQPGRPHTACRDPPRSLWGLSEAGRSLPGDRLRIPRVARRASLGGRRDRSPRNRAQRGARTPCARGLSWGRFARRRRVRAAVAGRDLPPGHCLDDVQLDPGYRASASGGRRGRACPRPGGALLWYDLRVNNPSNSSVRKIDKTELAALFPGLAGPVQSTTLAPPLSRRLASRNTPLWPAFSRRCRSCAPI